MPKTRLIHAHAYVRFRDVTLCSPTVTTRPYQPTLRAQELHARTLCTFSGLTKPTNLKTKSTQKHGLRAVLVAAIDKPTPFPHDNPTQKYRAEYLSVSTAFVPSYRI
jgi:hypothetical protein